MLRNIFMVFIGGGVGSILRYLVSYFTDRGAQTFPIATLIVNVVGCFVIGLLVGCGEHAEWFDASAKLLLITGFCGGFTTFSAFSMENVTLWQSGHYGAVVLYIAASLVLGFAAVWGGLALAR